MAPASGWAAKVIALTAMTALAGGCGVERVETPAFGPAPTATTTSFPSMPTAPAKPMKYLPAALKTCLDIKQEVGGDLPPPQPDENQRLGTNSSSRACTFKAGESTIVFSVRSWENTDNAAGIRSGTDYAEEYFTERTKSWEQDSGVELGTDARWRANSTAACSLEILDENGVVIVTRADGTTIDQEQCRGSVREFAKKFFAAVQP